MLSRQQLTILGAGIGVGATLAWFLDPRSGARRRNTARDRILASFRRAGRRAERAGRGVASEAYGLGMKATHLREEPKEFDDVTLARKVETKIFRSPAVPKGRINVNAVDGVVYLRGELPSTRMIDELIAETRRVQGVSDVRSLLHLPGERAPSET
jgi:osmotically-inducible protein OsmY